MASVAYETMGDRPNAVAALRRAIVLWPRTIRYYIDFANLSFARKSYEAGIQVLNVGLALTPGASQLRLARASSTCRRDGCSRRRQIVRGPNVSIRHSPERLTPRCWRDSTSNDLHGAARLVREQIKARPKDAFLHYLLAEVLD